MKQISLRKSKKVRIKITNGFTTTSRLPYRQLDLLGREGKKMPKAKVEETINVPTGDYNGTIKNNVVVNRGSGDEKYQYHETQIELDIENKPVLKKGMPFSITENTLLGQTLMSFGADLKKAAKSKEELDTDDYLKVGSKVKVSVVRKSIKGNNGTFEVSNIDNFSPAK